MRTLFSDVFELDELHRLTVLPLLVTLCVPTDRFRWWAPALTPAMCVLIALLIRKCLGCRLRWLCVRLDWWTNDPMLPHLILTLFLLTVAIAMDMIELCPMLLIVLATALPLRVPTDRSTCLPLILILRMVVWMMLFP